MRIITLPECGSTNTSLKEILSSEGNLPEGTIVRAEVQTKGRGQRGNIWEAEPGKNLTFSVLLKPTGLSQRSNFLLSEAVAIATVSFLERYAGMKSDIRIKWPNDILADGKKIAGILIENSIGTDGGIIYSIVGIGLNVNQTCFSQDAPNAVSLSNITGNTYDLNALMLEFGNIIESIVARLEKELKEDIRSGTRDYHIEDIYKSLLWRREGIYVWSTPNGDEFEAEIVDIEPTGRMILKDISGRELGFWFKEVFPK